MADPRPDAAGRGPGGPGDSPDSAADGPAGVAAGPAAPTDDGAADDGAADDIAEVAAAILFSFPAGSAPDAEPPIRRTRTVPASLRAFLG